LVLVIVLAGATSYYGRAYWIKTHGIVVTPGQAIAAASVPYYLQNDARWRAETMGDSSYRLGGSGCLVACLASALSTLGVDTDPGRLNEAFSESGVYTPAGEVIWTRIEAAIPGVSYQYKRIFGTGALETDLAEGRFPLVRVRYLGSGAPHWVLVIGAGDGEFLVMDPLDTARAPSPLSRHGKVYAYRALVATEG
jgi:hypothetical protein